MYAIHRSTRDIRILQLLREMDTRLSHLHFALACWEIDGGGGVGCMYFISGGGGGGRWGGVEMARWFAALFPGREGWENHAHARNTHTYIYASNHHVYILFH